MLIDRNDVDCSPVGDGMSRGVEMSRDGGMRCRGMEGRDSQRRG
ncbi:hypothetical protein [Methanothrix sp.]